MKNIFTCNSEKLFQDAVTTSIHSRILKKNNEGTIFRLALSGGNTPGPIYRALAEKEDIDWSLVEIYLVDERYVALRDKQSNHHLVQQTLLKNLKSKPRKFHYFDTRKEIKEALKEYEQDLDSSDTNYFDLVLLGLGTDGHTASLFPQSPALKEKKSWVAHTTTDKFGIKDRLTLTYPALESSSEIFFLILGKQKQAIIDRVQQAKAKDPKLPAARLWHLDKTEVFFAEV